MSQNQIEEVYSPYKRIETFIDEETCKHLQTSDGYITFEYNTLIFNYIDFTSIDEIIFSGWNITLTKKAKLGNNLNNFEKSLAITINSISDEAIPNKKDSEKILDIYSIERLKFENCILNTLQIDDSSSIINLTLEKSNIKNRLIIEKQNIKSLDFSESTFHGKVKVKNCIKIDNANFTNTVFKDLADFYKSHFYNVTFNKTTFNDIVVFTESKFYKDVNFKYTTFEKLALFRKTVFEKIVDFEDSIFKEEANFLDITANMANRETARIIKNSFEQQNNIIEANRFYALEMKEREKELSKTINKENMIDWVIFKLHGLSSKHSQDPVLPVLWILNIAFIYSMFISTFYHDNVLAYISVALSLIGIVRYIFIKNDIFLKFILGISLLISSFLSFVTFTTVADKINPFSIMTSKDLITFGLLIFKITIAYLIYQFIVSVRQNTRRK